VPLGSLPGGFSKLFYGSENMLEKRKEIEQQRYDDRIIDQIFEELRAESTMWFLDYAAASINPARITDAERSERTK